MQSTATPSAGTRERVIEATIALMRRSGFSGAGINEILKESGAPKGSLYHFFPEGKRQIAIEALTVYAARVLALYDEALSTSDDPAKKIKALFRLAAQRLELAEFRLSCAAGAVSLDLEPELEPVRAAVTSFFERMVAMVARHFEFESKAKARAFAGLVLTAIEGGYVRGRAEHSSRAFHEASVWLAELAQHHGNQAS